MIRFHGIDPISTPARSNGHRLHVLLTAFLVLAATQLSGCKDAPSQDAAASGVPTAIEEAEKATPAADSTGEPGALRPGQRLQGTITLDVGTGPRTYRVIATKIADDLGKQAAARLGGAEGKAALDDANARVGGKTKVAASDVQELADAFAGKTMYSAQVLTVDIVKRQQVSIQGEAADGSRATLNFSLPIGGDEVLGSQLEYLPDMKRAMEGFEAESRDGAMRLTLERLQRGDAQTWSVAGTFDAANLQPGVLAKNLAGHSIERASGRFDVTELHVREP